MLTVKRIDSDHAQEVHAVRSGHVYYHPKSGVSFTCEDDTQMTFTSGKIYVMNENGATIQAHDLGSSEPQD